MKRRTFIKTAGLTTLSCSSPGLIGQVLPAQAAESRLPATGPLSGRRILTFNSVIAEPGRKQLHEVPIWLEIGQVGPYIRYCGSRG